MDKLLYIKVNDISFFLSDQRILEKEYHVLPFLLNKRKGSGMTQVLRFFSLVAFIIKNAYGTRLMVTWFADYHAAIMVFLGKLLRIKVVIIAGGQEAICYPELKKGVYYKKYRGRIVKYALRNAYLIIPNHQSLVYHENYYYDPDGKKDGIKHYIPDIKTKIVIIPNGMDPSKFYRDPKIIKNEKMILTVGTMYSIYDFYNKGFDLFIELAKRNPGLEFVLIGIRTQFFQGIEEKYGVSSISNLKIVFFYCPDDLLFEYYNKSKVFIQASITEGMPNTLLEAMLCECIPVGSRVNGIPDAIGDTGLIVARKDAGLLESAMKAALLMDTGAKARNHVLRNFTFEQREKALLTLFRNEFPSSKS